MCSLMASQILDLDMKYTRNQKSCACMNVFQTFTANHLKNFTITRKMRTVPECKMLVATLEKIPLESTLQ